MKAKPQYLTLEEVAELFKVHRTTVLRWMYKKLIPEPVRIGNTLRWNAEQFTHAALVKAEKNERTAVFG